MTFQAPQDIRIGWIGLGEMGLGMATNLQKYLASQQQQEQQGPSSSSSSTSPPLTVWNRSPGKTETLEALGAHVATSIEDLVSKTNVIFTSLSNDAAVENVYSQLFALANQRQDPLIFVEVSTIHPTLASRNLEQLTEITTPDRRHAYLQCPVFGRPPAAHAAQLVWVASGESKAIQRLNPYFAAMSKRTIDLETTNVAAASSFKLIGNFFVVGTIELLAEGLNLAERVDGIEPQAVLKFIETFFPTPSWIGYSQKMVDRSTSKSGGFPVELGLKDVGHMRRLAQSHNTTLPTADLAYKHLTTLKEEGKGDQDWSSLIDVLRDSTPQPASNDASSS